MTQEPHGKVKAARKQKDDRKTDGQTGRQNLNLFGRDELYPKSSEKSTYNELDKKCC